MKKVCSLGLFILLLCGKVYGKPLGFTIELQNAEKCVFLEVLSNFISFMNYVTCFQFTVRCISNLCSCVLRYI